MSDVREPLPLSDDEGLDIGFGEVDLGPVEGLSISPSDIDEALGLTGLLLDDESSDLGLEDSGLDLGLELSDEDDLNISTLLKTQADIGRDLKSYYQLALNALDKLYHEEPRQQAQKVYPPLTEFNYIQGSTQRSMVYGFFCQMLDDLTSFEQYANLSEEEALSEMLRELNNDLSWTPNVNLYKFRNTFLSYYGRNKKLAVSHVVSKGVQPGDLVDKERLQTAVDVFYVNSVPFEGVTRFFADATVINGVNANMNLDVLGDFALELLKKFQVKKLSYKLCYRGIAEFFGSEDLKKILQLTDDDLIDLSIGELLRRLLVSELHDGTFYPVSMAVLQSRAPDEALITQLVAALYVSIQQQSIAAEILFMVLNLMKVSGQEKVFNEFSVGIAQYLELFNKDKALVNPVFYTYIGNAGHQDGAQVFELAYAKGEESVSFQSRDVLYTVIGDNNNVFQVPLIYVDTANKCVVCPPNEVVTSIRQATVGGRMSVYGSASFKFNPSFSWLSTLSLASDNGEESDEPTPSGMVKNSNPLLNILMSYDNEFSVGAYDPRIMTITTSDVTLTGLERNKDDGIIILQMLVSGNVVPLKSGRCVLDDDGSGVLQYTATAVGRQEVVVLNPGEFTCETVSTADEVEGEALPQLDEVLGFSGTSTFSEGNRSLRTVVRRVCEMTAFDYESELKDVRERIVRDLSDIVGLRSLEPIIGSKIFSSFIEQGEKEGLGSFNLTAARELLDLAVGTPNILTGVSDYGPSTVAAMKDFSSAFTQSALSTYTNGVAYDPAVLALHVLSRGESRMAGTMAAYEALHYLPMENARLRELEDRMVLLHVLSEVGGEIESVIRRSPPLFAAYTKVCTAELFPNVEAEVRGRIKVPKVEHPLPTVRRVFANDLPSNFSLCKYFVLDHNIHGLLAGLEEYAAGGGVRFDDLYRGIRSDLGFGEDTRFTSMSESAFNEAVSSDQIAAIYTKYRGELFDIVHAGLIPEVLESSDLQVFKAYDLLCSYGSVLFNEAATNQEDFSDTSAWRDAFYKYVGSMIVSYCPVLGEGANDIDSGIDRWASYLRNRKDFVSYVPLAGMAALGLQDLRTVVSADDGISTEGDARGS